MVATGVGLNGHERRARDHLCQSARQRSRVIAVTAVLRGELVDSESEGRAQN